MKKFIILITVTAIFLLVFVAGGLAKPVEIINEKFDDYGPFQVYNYCTEEYVELSGTVHINGKLLSDQAEEIYYGVLQANCHFVGVGVDTDTDTEYIANGTLNFQVDSVSVSVDLATSTITITFEGTGILILTCISRGEELKFIFRAKVHTIEIIEIGPDKMLNIYWDECEWACPSEKL